MKTLGYFGCVGDGDGLGGGTPDETNIQAAIDACTLGGVGTLDGEGKIYCTPTGLLTFKSGIEIINATFDIQASVTDGAKIFGALTDPYHVPDSSYLGEDGSYGGGGSMGPEIALTGNVIAGGDTIPVADSTGVLAGDWVRIYSDEWWDNEPQGLVGEVCRVDSVDPTHIYLKAGVDYRYNFGSPTNSRLRVIYPVKNVILRNVGFLCNPLLHQHGIRAGLLEEFHAEYCWGRGATSAFMTFKSALASSVSNCHSVGGTPTGDDPKNYGVVWSGGSFMCRVSGGTFEDHRHATDTGGGKDVISRMIESDGVTTYASRASGLDNHRAADLVTLRGARIYNRNNEEGVVNCQAARCTIDNIHAANGAGFGVQWEPRVTTTAVKPSAIISNIHTNPRSGVGIRVHNAGNQPINKVVINGFAIEGPTDTGIEIYAETAAINDISITSGACKGSERSVYIHGLKPIKDGVICGNTFENRDTVSQVMLLAGTSTDTSPVTDFKISDNTMRAGSRSVKGQKTDRIWLTGNNINGATNAATLEGAASVIGPNMVDGVIV